MKKILLTIAIVLTMLAPQTSYAQPLIDMEDIFTDIEKAVMEAKGFNWRTDLGGDIDPFYIRENFAPITKEEMIQIDNWCEDVINKSGASRQKTQRDKAIMLTIYLKSFFPYNVNAFSSQYNYDKSTQLRAIPYLGTATCSGYAKILVRLLDVAGIESYVAQGKHKGSHHDTVRAYLDGKWISIEATGHEQTYNYYNHLGDKRYLESVVFPQINHDIAYVYKFDDINKAYGCDYNIYVRKDIENFLSKNNFNIYGY